jgi:hypothetical protein
MKYARALAINGSPRGAKGNTEQLLVSLLGGMEEAGSRTETLRASELRVEDCTGCFGCWTATPGRCWQQDDMERVLEAIRRAELIVWATPLYHFGMTARLKRILERTLPLVKPWIVPGKDRYTHPSRYPGEGPRAWILASNAGFPDPVHFEPLEAHVRTLAGIGGVPLLASILVPMGGLLTVPECAALTAPLREALRTAGREIALDGTLSPGTREALARPFMDERAYAAQTNAFWSSRLRDETPPPEAPMP